MTQNGGETTELLVLDPYRDGWGAMVAEAGPGTAVLLLDQERDGLAEVLDALRGRAPLARIRLAGSDGPGGLRLGRLTLDTPALAARQADLARLGSHIAPGGMLELRVADASAASGRFVAALARLLGRDVRPVPGLMPGAAPLPHAAFLAGPARQGAMPRPRA